MADNVVSDPGAGGATFATDDIGGVHYPRSKVVFGADGVATDVSAVDPLPVTGVITAPIPAGTNNIGDVDVLSLPALPAGTNNIGDVDVLSLPAIPAGTNNIGDVDIASIAAGDNNIGNVDIVSLPALPAGTNNIGDVDILSIAAGDNNIGNVDIVSLPALPSGTNNIGDVDVLSLPALPAGTNNIGDVDVLSLPALPAGSNAIGTVTAVGAAAEDAAASGNPVLVGGRYDSPARTLETGDAGALALNASGQLLVEIAAGAGSGGTAAADDADFTAGTTSGTPVMGVYESSPTNVTDGDVGIVGITQGRAMKVAEGGAALTALQLIDNIVAAEDAVAGSGYSGVPVLVVRQDSQTGLAADGDFVSPTIDSAGGLRVSIVAGAGSGGTAATDDAAFTAGSGSGTPMMGFATSDSVDSGDVGVLAMTVARELKVSLTTALPAGTANIGDVDVLSLPALAAGTNNIGDVDVLTVPADPFGANADAASATGSISAKLRFIASTGIPVTGTVTVASHAVTNAGTFPVQIDGAALTALQLIDDPVKTDDAAFTPGTDKVMMIGAQCDATGPDSVDEGDAGALRMTADRAMHVSIRDSAGNNRGLNIDASGQLAVTLAASQTLTTVTTVSTVTNVATIGTSVTPGTSAAHLGKAVDGAAGSTDTGVLSLAVRDDVLATLTPVDNDYTQLRVDSTGAQWMRSAAEIADDAAFTPATSRVMPVGLFADETATDSVDEGDIGAARMTLDRKQIVTLYAHATAGGHTPYKNLDVDESEDEVKGSAGKLFWLHAMNLSAAKLYLKIYNNTAAGVTVGTTVPDLTFPVPTMADTNGAGFTINFGDIGIAMGTGITIACTTGFADNSTGAPGTNEMIVNLGYA